MSLLLWQVLSPTLRTPLRGQEVSFRSSTLPTVGVVNCDRVDDVPAAALTGRAAAAPTGRPLAGLRRGRPSQTTERAEPSVVACFPRAVVVLCCVGRGSVAPIEYRRRPADRHADPPSIPCLAMGQAPKFYRTPVQ